MAEVIKSINNNTEGESIFSHRCRSASNGCMQIYKV